MITDVGVFEAHGAIFTERSIDPIIAPAEIEAAALSSRQQKWLLAAWAERLMAAKGAMVAIGLEATGALVLYLILQLWHILR